MPARNGSESASWRRVWVWTAAKWKSAGQAILEKVLGLEAYRRAKLVHTYVSSKENEVDTRALICACLNQGKRVAVPVVMSGTKTLAHALIDGLDQLVVGPWGLAQPDPGRGHLVARRSADRLGRGAGPCL